MRWGIKYNISFNTLRDKYINIVAHGFLSDTLQIAFLEKETEELKEIISTKLSQKLCSNRWTCINERFEGIIVQAMINYESETFALGLKEIDSKFRGDDGIVKIIRDVIQDYKIDESKLVIWGREFWRKTFIKSVFLKNSNHKIFA